ncbi:hypothetical protein HK100_003665 [Physocladia obscura]|uniref:Uncharacterized protein n=1 Tax=Physocladia obscura TaxID=109957 RepID=A0AAD5T6R6_9FUNG|nr:hypothetical protein HK100_003665 [Physocladia obscura]
MQAAKEALRLNGAEEKVEVNQRHLIDKILARYSAENTIFRELLQNSNDAGATAAEIHFKTTQQKPSLNSATPPDTPKPLPAVSHSSSTSSSFFGSLVSSFVNTTTQLVALAPPLIPAAKKQPLPIVSQVVYKNNGRPFLPDDWARLRKIAEGNPDETKIGFFGVDLREQIEIPNIAEFGRFLANSLAFTKNLKKVEVFVDDQRVILLDKKVSEPRPLAFPKGIYNLASPNGIFDLKSISVSKIQLDLSAFLDYDYDSTKVGNSTDFTIYMRIATASVGVRLSSSLSKEMERTTKKKAPTITDFHIQFSNYDEYESSTAARAGKGGIFSDLIPGPKDQGKVFIGFPTHQTTGFSIHLAAHLIPTVERENIDFVDRNLNIWNQDLLTVSGLLSRILFDDEMSSISELFSGGTIDDITRLWLYNRASHALCSFTSKPSTPSHIVGRLNQMFFFKGSTKTMNMISTKGVLPLSDVRLPDSAMKGFIKDIPIVPSETLTLCSDLIRELQNNKLIQTIGLADVLKEVSKRTLATEEVIELLKWWRQYKRSNAVSVSDSTLLFQSLILIDPTAASEKAPVRMADLKYHVNIKVIAPGLPLPESVLPVEISKHFSKQDLEDTIGFITELSIPQWLAFVVTVPEFKSSSEFVEKVLATTSRQYLNLNREAQTTVCITLSAHECIPTKQGLKKARDTYFKSVTLFDDLPVIALESPRLVSDAFLKALGVRDYVDLAVVFARLQDLKWDSDHVQLVKYLTSVQDKLTGPEIGRLKMTNVFTKEELSLGVLEAEKKDGAVASTVKKQRFKAGDLYAPNDAIRALGLPILDWPGKVKWRSTSDEAKFMSKLGLKTIIPWEELVENAAKCETNELRFKFLEYFIDNWKTVYAQTYSPTAVKHAFLPSDQPETKLYKPHEIFASPTVAIVGFPFLHRSLQSHAEKFGVRDHPNGAILLNVLRTTPPTIENAVKVFSYYAGRQSEFSSTDWNVLRTLKFVPITAPKDSPANTGGLVWIEPTKVYFGSKNSSTYQDLFTHIDFGEISNAFLRACGVKDEPTPQELTEQLVRNPQSFMNQLGFAKYLQVLRTIAANYYQLRSNRSLVSEMRESAFLVGVKSEQRSGDGEDDNLQYQLAKAKEIYIMDDTVLGQLFTPLGCPIETLLEEMYNDLGSQWLTTQVSEVTTPQGRTISTDRTRKLQMLINERALLLLYDGQQVRASKDIVTGSEEALKNMEVMEVPEIIIQRSFQGVSKKQSTTCCLMMEKNTRKYYLLIKGNEAEVDYFDVAQALGKVIFRKSRLNDALLLSSLLSTSLVNLKRKGFPVDRILNLQEGKLKAAKEAAANRVKLLEEEEQKTERKVTEVKKTPLSPEQVAISSTLQSLFPDVEPNFLQSQIESEKGNPSAIEAISNKLLDFDYPKSVVPKANDGSSSLQQSSNSKVGKSDEELSKSANKIADAVKGGFIGNLWERATGSSFGNGANLKNPEKQKLIESPNTQPSQSSQHASNNNDSIVKSPGVGGAGGGELRPVEEISPQFTENLKKQLSSSINTVKQSYDKEFRANIPNEPEPQAQVPARHSGATCKPLLDSDLILSERLLNEIPFYIDKNSLTQAQAIVSANRTALMRFVDILKLLAAVFGLQNKAFNIYWDASGGTVAFNRLHYKDGAAPGIRNESVDAVYYWFLTACHELAHNFVSQHDANHEFYFSGYAENYLGPLNRSLKLAGLDP